MHLKRQNCSPCPGTLAANAIFAQPGGHRQYEVLRALARRRQVQLQHIFRRKLHCSSKLSEQGANRVSDAVALRQLRRLNQVCLKRWGKSAIRLLEGPADGAFCLTVAITQTDGARG